MKLYYYIDNKGNFGDDLNAWLWERLLPGILDENEDVRLSGIGTIISGDMPKAKQWFVMGSGVGYAPPPKGFGGEGWDILCVRGPLTCDVLGLSEEKAVTDSAICLSLLPDYTPLPEEQRAGIVFMPHHGALEEGAWEAVCHEAGIEYIDPGADDRETLERIRKAKLVIADAMHAAIVADTLRVPWIPVVSSPEINSFKWLDWTLSMKLPYKPTLLPFSSRREALRSLFLRPRGLHYYFEEQTKVKAVQIYKAMRKLKTRKWWLPWRKSVSLVYYTLRTLLRGAENVLGYDQSQNAYIKKAAIALKEASNGKPFLSDQKVFEKRQQQMMALLEELKKKAK